VAIGEFITDGDSGLLVAPGAPDELASALARMIADPDFRQRLAQRAGEIVRTRFSFEAGVDWIAAGLGQTVLQAPLLSEALLSEALASEARAAE
jgi:glycosyltransferase involved in cell wall biosynthesis